ncbi:MAG: hypothetical protein J6Y32_05265 [Bacteroidales bacterium]|nr:hypothetical protein [Bacteroidales bacterium]
MLLTKYFGTRSVKSARAHLPDPVLEHLIGQNLPHFLPDQVLEHCFTLFLSSKRSDAVLQHRSTLFLALFQRARVLAVACWRSSLEAFSTQPAIAHCAWPYISRIQPVRTSAPINTAFWQLATHFQGWLIRVNPFCVNQFLDFQKFVRNFVH